VANGFILPVKDQVLTYVIEMKEMKHQHVSKLQVSAAAFQSPASRRSALSDALAILLMLLAVVLVYWPPPAQPDTVLIGLDYMQLHSRRMQFARDALFAPGHALPAWYPRELLGTPFWSNVQNFPFIPTRLLVLLTMEPAGPHTYAVAVILSAVLAALFTYLYARKVGLGRVGCAAAGWTFACSGYYASRVAAGHLPLLEGYPGLPLLLWIIESERQAHERGSSLRKWIGAAAISSTCVMLSGHPQLPAYSMSVAGLYALWRGGLRRSFWVWGAMALGVGLAAFALVPMVMLIGRSTRVLALASPLNDLSMPYGRLLAFFLPWRDGAPWVLDPEAANPFHGYPNLTYFWDTVCYTGLLPWITVGLLFAFVNRVKLERRAMKIASFVLMLGIAGIVLSLPLVHEASSLIPGTILRSPARFIYVTEFALAIALGTGVHWAIASVRPRVARLVVPLLLIIHVIDLGGHDRQFILRGSLLPAAESEVFASILKSVGDGRAAIDYSLPLQMNRSVDDVGFFDSIMLARPYRAVLSLANAPRDLNIQTFDGSELSSRALAATGVKLMLTTAQRDNLRSEGQILGIRVYSIPSSSPRAEFFDADQIRYLPTDQIDAMLRDPEIDLHSVLLLPREATPAASRVAIGKSKRYPTVEYRRSDSDHIECTVTTERSGYLRVIESWDPGWSATVDGSPVPIVPAMDALLAVGIPPGRHEIRFVYSTPGVRMGAAISLSSLALLCGLVCMSGLKRQRQT
jgi:hypothetical protein